MKKNIKSALALGTALALYLAVPFQVAAQVWPEQESSAQYTVQESEQMGTSEPSPDTGPFFCYTVDAQRHQLNGYWAEQENVWYLFETSTLNMETTELHYTGDIITASVGTLDTERAVLLNAFRKSGDQVTLTEMDGTEHTVVALQSSLPSVYITLNGGTTLDQIHADKDVKYAGNSISIMDPNGQYNLEVDGLVEMKGRGNSTWTFYDKKGYQIKFDKKTAVMGMGKAKKWVLLANAGDDSMMRTQLIYDMASGLDMGYVPTFRYVDLWVDGEYRGTYMLGEKAEIGSSRLNLSEDTGALYEHDEVFYQEEDYWLYSTSDISS